MKREDYEIGQHYIFINRKECKYIVSRLVDIIKGEFTEKGVRYGDSVDNFIFKAVGGGLWAEIHPLPEYILKDINFIATSAILK